MILDLTDNGLFMIANSDDTLEMNQLRLSLTRESDDAWVWKKKNKNIVTKRNFINQLNYIPVGCWAYVGKVCHKFNIPLYYSPKMSALLSSFALDRREMDAFFEQTFKDSLVQEPGKKPYTLTPYSYQSDATYNLLKYKKACCEISMSGGKTLVAFMLFKYLYDTGKSSKMLYVVPSIALATQSKEKFELYQSGLKSKGKPYLPGILKGTLTKQEREDSQNADILFATWQSLSNQDEDFFKKFDSVIVDESHHAKDSKSIKTIISNCENANYVFGMTGTHPKENTLGYLNMCSYIGPLVYVYHTHQLIHEAKTGTPVYVIFDILDYATDEQKETLYEYRSLKDPNDTNAGVKLLRQEQAFVNTSYTRLKYIGDQVINAAKNTMVLFGDVKSGYGKKIQEYIKVNSDKNVYYCDGYTPPAIREEYKKLMEEDTTGKTVIIASIGTFGEGIDIKNVWNIYLVNTAKSERLVRQIFGRGLRNYPGKEKTLLFDIVDDLNVGPIIKGNKRTEQKWRYNYLWKHYLDRKSTYEEQKLPVYTRKIDFSKPKISHKALF